ncbi:Transducin beta-like, partial [Coemansia sp. RSA 1694]
WHPAGKYLASASDDGSVKVWSMASDTPVQDFFGHAQQVYTVKWLPRSDKAIVASASFDGTVRVWDVQSGACLRVLSAHTAAVHCLSFSSDGRYLASGSFDKNVRIWNIKDGSLFRTFAADDGIHDVQWAAKDCEQVLVEAYEAVAHLDKLVEKAYDAHSSIYKTFGDLAGISTIRKDKSVAEAAHTDISNTLDAMRSMVGSIGQLQGMVGRLEKKPRERLISDKVQELLAEYSPYVRLMTEQAKVKDASELISSSVRELDMSAMRLQIGDFGEGLSEKELDQHIRVLEEKYPKMQLKKHVMSKRACMLVVRIPTIAQLSISMKLVDCGASELYEVNSLHVFSDDERGPHSKHHVFNRIAYDANILWFSITGFSVEHRLAKVTQWFSLFANLFSATCSVCRQHLQIDPRTTQYLPPLWRDIDAKTSGRAFHYGCLESA